MRLAKISDLKFQMSEKRIGYKKGYKFLRGNTYYKPSKLSLLILDETGKEEEVFIDFYFKTNDYLLTNKHLEALQVTCPDEIYIDETGKYLEACEADLGKWLMRAKMFAA